MGDADRRGLSRLVRRRGTPGEPRAKGPIDWRETIRARLTVTALAFAAWTGVIEARLIYLQVFRHDAFVARAESQHIQTLDVPGKRGDIVDRFGRMLAYSVDVESLTADPGAVEDKRAAAAQICAALDDCDAGEQRRIEQTLARKSRFVFLKRKVSLAEEQRLRALELRGIGLVKESRRFYPNREMLAHVLGFVGVDNDGLGGLEAVYDEQVRGRTGQILVESDARRNVVASRVLQQPTAGASLELTIDQVLQHIVERELKTGVLENRAEAGSAIVMDPWTGEILAMANYPTFNPNVFARAADEVRRNRATQEIYEPGSTFKIVTASAALEEDVVEPDDPIDCAPGHIRFGSRVIRDDHVYSVLPFSDVIAKSSNVGAIKVGLQLGPERLVRYVKRFGFGQTLSRDFRGEAAGIVWNPALLNPSALASVSMGYQIGVTPLQMASAVSSVANGGTLFEPRVIRALVRNGQRQDAPPKPLRQTIAPDTASALTSMMEAVVEYGTAKSAQIPGYTIAGKTGTAQKLVNGTYASGAYNASFVGFLPSRKPQLSIVVVVDTPRARGYYGGVVAAPIFRRIAEAAVRHLGIPATINPPAAILASRRTDAVAPTPVSYTHAERVSEPVRGGVMPDLRGLSAREAVRALTLVGMTARLSGAGFVVQQSCAPGTPLQPGEACALTLTRRPPAPPGGPAQ